MPRQSNQHLPPRTPKPIRAPSSLHQLTHLVKLRLNPPHNPQLRNPVPRLDLHRTLAQIRHHHLDLPPIPRINNPPQIPPAPHRPPRPTLHHPHLLTTPPHPPPHT